MAPTQELNMISLLLPLAGIVFVITIGVILLNQHFRKNLYRQLATQEELKTLHQQALLKSSIEVQERERKRIAQDLHDELGASLSIARMNIMQLEEQIAHHENKQILHALQNIRGLAEGAMASMRRISHELMPPQLESFGLAKTLEAVATQVNSLRNIHIQVNTSNEMRRLPWLAELGVYRITMELINNTLKHAEAKEVTVSLHCETDSFILHYQDDGKGHQGNENNSGLGLKNLEARVSALKGTFDIAYGHGAGFEAQVKIPLFDTADYRDAK